MSLDQITEGLIARQTPEAQAIIRLLLAQIAGLRVEVARLKKTPQNSSLPPSKQHPHAKPPRKPKSKKKQGGQPGHRKHERPLIPPDQCDDVVPLKPTQCRRCGTKLLGQDPQPLRSQVWELPEIKPLVTEFQRHRLACPCCGETTCGELPPGVPTGQSGPRLVAFTGLLMAFFRQSKRRTALFLETLLNQPCCPALTVKMQTQFTAAVRRAYEELAAQLPTQEQLSIDESPTKQQTSKAWLWVFVAQAFTVFAQRHLGLERGPEHTTLPAHRGPFLISPLAGVLPTPYQGAQFLGSTSLLAISLRRVPSKVGACGHGQRQKNRSGIARPAAFNRFTTFSTASRRLGPCVSGQAGPVLDRCGLAPYVVLPCSAIAWSTKSA